MVTRIFGYWGFEDRCELVEESIGVEIITATGSTNDGVDGKHRYSGQQRLEVVLRTRERRVAQD